MDQFSNIFRHCLHVGGLVAPYFIWDLDCEIKYIYGNIYGNWILAVVYSSLRWILIGDFFGLFALLQLDRAGLSRTSFKIQIQEVREVSQYAIASNDWRLNQSFEHSITKLISTLRLTKGNCDKKPSPMDVSNWFWSHLIESHPIPIGYKLFYFFQKIKTWTD